MPNFRSIPLTEEGMPVSRASFCFAMVIPSDPSQLKLKPNFPIMVYLCQGTKNIQSSGKGLFFNNVYLCTQVTPPLTTKIYLSNL